MPNLITYDTSNVGMPSPPPTPSQMPTFTPPPALSQMNQSLIGQVPLGGPGSAAAGRGGAAQMASPTAQLDPNFAQAFGQANNAQGLFNLFSLADQPNNQSTLNQIANYQRQLDLNAAGYQTQTGYINQSAQNQLAANALTGQSQGIQQGALQRQSQLLPQQYDITKQQLGIAGQQLGLQGQGLDIQQQSQAIQGQGLQQQLADLYYGNTRAQQNLIAQKAAAGGGNTAGQTLGLQDLAQQLASSVSGVGRAQAQLGLQGQQLGLSRQQLGLQQQGLGLQGRSAELNYNEQMAQNKDAQNQLDIMQQKTGLDKKEIENRTQQALDQAGLSANLNKYDIFNAMADAMKGLYNPVQQTFGAIYQMTGLNPFLSAMQQGGLGG